MKVCIVTYDEYINIPYVSKYEKLLNEYNIEYDLILWNRRSEKNNVTEKKDNKIIYHLKTRPGKINKIVPFIRYKIVLSKILKRREYDKMIILTTVPALMIWRKLIFKYSDKYLLDIRDYTYEDFFLYRFFVSLLVSKSKFTSISSKKFQNFLPKQNNIFITHNIMNPKSEVFQCDFGEKEEMVFGFVGGIRYFEINKKIIDSLKDSQYINMFYIGKSHIETKIQDYCNEMKYTHVEVQGQFLNEDKANIYKRIDLINCIYGNGNKEVTLALPNKLYDAVIFKTPIVVSKNTFLSEIVNEYSLGISIDIETESLEKKIVEYKNTFDEKEFLIGCNKFLLKIIEEENLATIYRTKFIEEDV